MKQELKKDFKYYLALSTQQTLAELESNEEGLTSTEAEFRLSKWGPNEVKETHKHPLFIDALLHSANPLTIILLIAALISIFTHNITNSGIIFIIIIISIVLDYIQSHRSLVAMKCLQAQVATTATVLRDKRWIELHHRLIVPGDIIRLSAGDLVPADAILLTAKDLYVQQASITGESLPVEKESRKSSSISFDSITECKHAVFVGTSVYSGSATAIIVKTGCNTQFGKIAHTLTERTRTTSFDKDIAQFSLFIMYIVLLLVIFILTVGAFLKHDFLETLLFAIALGVGLTPEFLPMITTVTLAKGARRMAHNHVIIKNLTAIQVLGSIDILCSDKTGTLTSGEMKLERSIDITGKISQTVFSLAYLNCSFSSEIQNPLHTAVLQKSHQKGVVEDRESEANKQNYSKIDEIPFTFERRRSSVVLAREDDLLLITKGAPEFVLKICRYYEQDNQLKPFDIEAQIKCQALLHAYSEQGYRILAIAYNKCNSKENYSIEDEINLILVGFLLFLDPPHPEAAEAIASLQQMGIKIKVLTGDNELVAQHLCKQLNLEIHNVLRGNEIENLSDKRFSELVEATTIFARESPQQKQQIVTELNAHGHLVGFLGDGINDAPALHAANVGISVANATDIARETADIILLKRTLKALMLGILEGRRSFGNIMKYLMMSTSSNFGNVISMAVAILFLPFLPMLPVQILLNNLLYDFAQITIPTDKVENYFIQKPSRWNINIIRHFMFYAGPISSLFDLFTFYILLTIFHASEALFQSGWFVESLATQTLVIFVLRTTKNPFLNRPSKPLIMTVFTSVFVGLSLPFSPLAKWLGFVSLPATYLGVLCLIILGYLSLIELVKRKLIIA